MQILNDQIVEAKTPELTERFWKQLEQGLEQGLEEMSQTLFNKSFRGADVEMSKTETLNVRTFANVREQMGNEAMLYYSQPSRFMHRFLSLYI